MNPETKDARRYTKPTWNIHMIKIVSGNSIPAGSTIALVNLCNQFNDRGHECIFYGPDRWHLDKCRSAEISEFYPQNGDIIIVHHIKLFSAAELYRLPDKIEQLRKKTRLDSLKNLIRKRLPGPRRLTGIKLILSCQENDLFPLRQLNDALFDKIHYADLSQASLHKIPRSYFICPNFGNRLTASEAKPDRVAGIIGSIRKENQTESSVEKALADGMESVVLYGYLLDPVYYYVRIQPLTQKYPGRIRYAGFIDDKQKMYDSISDVYRAVARPWSLVKRECRLTNTSYHGPDPDAGEPMTDDQMFAVWKNELGL
jgi:hypothetical protein